MFRLLQMYFKNKPYIVMAYDSRVDKFSKVKQMFPWTNGTTPEGLCFEAIQKELFQSTMIWILLPKSFRWTTYFPVKVFTMVEQPLKNTNKMVKMIESMGIQPLSYFISDWEINEDSSDARDSKECMVKQLR